MKETPNILLTDGLPEERDGIALSTDYRNMIRVNLLMLEEEALSEHQKVILSLHQLFETMPKDLRKATYILKWFYSRGKISDSDDEQSSSENGTESYFSFSQDADTIYAAFFQTYKIDLEEVEHLHWWKFLALFENLPENTMIKRVMYWRSSDINDVPKHEKEHVRKMKNLFALKKANGRKLTAEELNQQSIDKVARRFEEARRRLENRKDKA